MTVTNRYIHVTVTDSYRLLQIVTHGTNESFYTDGRKKKGGMPINFFAMYDTDGKEGSHSLCLTSYGHDGDIREDGAHGSDSLHCS